jgi:tRNA G18 (ribose-2'-O)-methylase SpoU
MEFVVILHNIRSAYNVGACFRTADGAGVKKIYLTGYSACPYFAQTRNEIKISHLTKAQRELAKTALGAEKNILWEKKSHLGALLQQLKKDGFEIVALEQSDESIDYRGYKPKQKTVLLVGNEVRGVDKKILKQCDKIIEIPMRGKKNSLNVSVAFGIASFEIAGKMERMAST